MRWWRSLGLSCAALTLLAAAPSAAEWPVARRDARRTGHSPAASNIQKPAQYWRSYLGGALSGVAFLVDDTDGDGAIDVLYAAGGRLALARPDGEVLWQTQNLGFQAVVDVIDIDGDGAREVIARSAGAVSLVEGRSGAIRWQQPEGEMGTLSAVRVADLDGDGRPDLFLDRCGCCAVEGTSPGEIYTFGGDLSSPGKLGPLAARDHCNAAANTLGDWDGDGDLDLLLPTSDGLQFVTVTGQLLGASSPIAPFIGGARCEAANVDGVPGDEAICLLNVGVGSQSGRRVFAVGYRPSQSPAAEVLWDAALAPAVDGDLRAPGRLLWDLDGAGPEVVVSSRQADGVWSTWVFDAGSGAIKLLLEGHLAQAMLPLPGAQPLIVTSMDGTLHGMRYQGGQVPSAATVWQVPDRRVPAQVDRALARRSGLSEGAPLVDLDGDGRRELLLESTVEPGGFHAYAVDDGGAIEVASYALDAGVGLVGLATLPTIDPAARLAVSRDDGYLALLDGSLTTLNPLKEGKETLPGMRVGAYGTGAGGLFTFGRAPLAARLDPGATADSVLVVDARGDLIRIDAGEASNVSPARPSFRMRDSFGASILRDPGAPSRVACFRRRQPVTDPPTYALAVADSAGQEILGLPLSRPPAWDVLPADLDGDGALDLVGMTLDSSAATEILALRADGAPLWQSALTAQFGTSPLAVADWNDDGADDVGLAINTARVLAGPTGALLGESPGTPFLAYFMPILLDVAGDAAPEMTLQGGLYGARTLSHDLQSTLWEGPDDRPYPYGALAACNGVITLIEGSLASTARLAITPLSGPAAGARASVVLAGGEAFPDEAAAQAAGALLGQLGDVAVSGNLGGADLTPTALVGSTDGWLYAVDACTGALRWSHRFEAPVGAPILGDTDGDGRDDIVVSVADGYLYGLRHEILPAPSYVWDVDALRDRIDEDLDEIETETALYARWAAVPGASSYEVAVVGEAGTYLTDPPWVDVGDATLTTLRGLPLEDGAKFYVGIRAVGPAGRGPDRPSDGVIVRLRPGADGPGGSGGGRAEEYLLWGRGCACRLGDGGEGVAGIGAIAVAIALGCARRSSRRAGRSARLRP